jgi:Chloroplast import apparatus Tic20-like
MWRETNGPTDRIISSLVYMLPLGSALGFGMPLFQQFDFLQPLILVLAPFAFLTGNNITGILLFVGVILTINNQKILHFIRYNVLQAFLLMVSVWLVDITFSFFGTILGSLEFWKPLTEVLGNTVFLGIFAAAGFSIFQSIQGRYPEIPAISDAVYTQVR